MTITLHNLSKSKARSKPAKRVGRGWGSGKGKTGGKGTKGQKARSGGGKGLKLLGLKAQLQSMPKLGGFTSLYKKSAIVNLDTLEKNFKNGDKVTKRILADKGLVPTVKNGVKILGNGALTKKLHVFADSASEQAIEAITKAGGTISVAKKPVAPEKK